MKRDTVALRLSVGICPMNGIMNAVFNAAGTKSRPPACRPYRRIGLRDIRNDECRTVQTKPRMNDMMVPIRKFPDCLITFRLTIGFRMSNSRQMKKETTPIHSYSKKK
jgi:hypothetical protein